MPSPQRPDAQPTSLSLMATSRSKSTAETVGTVDVRIVVSDSPRELTYTIDGTPADTAAAVEASLAQGQPLRLTDDKGRTVIVAADKIAAVEIGVATERRVGFAG